MVHIIDALYACHMFTMPKDDISVTSLCTFDISGDHVKERWV